MATGTFSVRVDGVGTMVERMKQMEAKALAAASTACNAAAMTARRVAMDGCPVGKDRPNHKGGTLKRSHHTRRVHRERYSILYELYNNAPYAVFVLRGHRTRSGSFVAGRDWITPALIAAETVLRERGAAEIMRR